ncbi:hypothetical protein BE04_36310 [Sorangium cellulosum]|uniref:Uncharacterized protein n=1 Tax=Sorangium cellulosum TaxID=56 RepID=A0A150PIG0_SORCE|nr:hypothetical protein BE04_36310 [Sorangium cellulosum]
MANALTTRWSDRALDALRAAPVVPRTPLADLSPTRELDDELYELTGRRGMPVVDGTTLGYPATIDAPTDECQRGYCLWGRGHTRIRLNERLDGVWETADLGSTISWRACVELLVLRQQYRSWIPVLVCKDALPALPRRWGRDLALALGLGAIDAVDNAFCDDEILCWDSHFLARSINGSARILERCSSLGFCASMPAPDAHLTFVSDIEQRSTQGGLEHLHRGPGDDEVVVSIAGRDLIRQQRMFRGHVMETVEATPTRLERIRRHPPALGSARLREYLRRHAVVLPAAPPPAAMAGAPEELLLLGRTLLLRPGEGNMWLGLWRIEDLPDAARRAAPTAVAVARGAPKLARGEWPFYRWGDLDMICIGGGPEFESYLCDATGAMWSCDAAYGHFEFVGGGVVSWLERLAFNADLDAMGHASALLTIPLKAWGELPERLNVPLVRECSDARSRLYVSAAYAIWESSPTRGIPVVDVRARGSRELIPVVTWARERWGTMKVAVSGDDGTTEELADAIEAEGIRILDGETGGWTTASFWDG